MDAETARCDWGGCDLCAFARERPSRVRRDIYSETLYIYSLAYAVRVHANDVASRCDAVGTFAIHHRHRKHPKHEPINPSNKHRHRHRHQSINPCAPRHRWRAESHTYIPHTSPSYSSAIAIAIPHPSIHRRRRPHSRVLSQKPSIHRSRVLLFRRRRRRRRGFGDAPSSSYAQTVRHHDDDDGRGKIFRILAPNLCGVATDRPTERPSSVWLPCARDDDGGVLACDTQDVVVVCFIFILFYFERARYGVFSGDAMGIMARCGCAIQIGIDGRAA